MESTTFQLLASVCPWLSCHLPLPFTALDAAEPCLLHSAAPTAEGRQQCCSQKTADAALPCPLWRIIACLFSFLWTVIWKNLCDCFPWAVIRSWGGCARLEGKTQPLNCSNNHNVVGIFLTTRSEELCIFCAVKCPLQFSLRQVRVSALGRDTRAIQHQAGDLQQSWEENPGFLTPYSY